MFLIGFELEFISPLRREELQHLLKKEIPQKLKIVDDVTLRTTKKHPYGHEIVTPPLSTGEATMLLYNLFEFLKKHNCIANKSTGFHVNVSYAEKSLNKWLNPRYLLEALDYNKILVKWGRENNLYCRPFEYYYKIVEKKVRQLYKPNDWTDPYVLMGYSLEQTIDFSIWKFLAMVIDSDSYQLGDKYTTKAFDLWDIGQGKHSCLNLHYIRNRGYIEFRMIGGPKYLDSYDSVYIDIKMILSAMERAIKRSTEK